MANKLSQLDTSWSATEVINMLNKNNHFTLKAAGGGHGQAWSVTNHPTASGSIPMASHGAKNLVAAIKVLIAARDTHKIGD